MSSSSQPDRDNSSPYQADDEFAPSEQDIGSSTSDPRSGLYQLAAASKRQGSPPEDDEGEESDGASSEEDVETCMLEYGDELREEMFESIHASKNVGDSLRVLRKDGLESLDPLLDKQWARYEDNWTMLRELLASAS